jgi:hypothetical protein
MPSIDRGFTTTTNTGDSQYLRTNANDRNAKAGLYNIDNAVYPLNLENDHFVRFYINIDDESRLIRDGKVQVVGDVDRTSQNRASRGNVSQTRIDLVTGTLGAVAGSAAASQLASASKNPNALINKIKGFKSLAATAGKSPFSRALTTALGAAGGAALGVLAANTLNVTKTLKRLGATITLYSPPTMAVDYSMTWDEKDADIIDLMSKDRGEELVKNLSVSNKDGLPAKIVNLIAINASKDIQLVTRTTKNPKKDFLFRDVKNRRFSFGYTFAPRSPKEAEEVARIIYMFKLFSHPELLDGYDNFLYLYPAEWDIVYGFKDPNADENNPTPDHMNKYLNRISSCVLDGIHINYAPGGSFQSLRRGEPVMTTMNLSFIELESLHQGRIEEGY